MGNKKKKVLFVCYGLGLGGIEKCLVNLLNSMPEDLYTVDVLLMNPQYNLKSQIKRDIQYLDTFQYVMNVEDTLSEIKKRGGILRNSKMFLAYCLFRLRIKIEKNAWLGFKILPEKYDIAIAFSQNDYSPYYVIDKVQAKRKVLWYHNGAYERPAKKYVRDKQYYNLFDYIVAVSNDCAEMLKKKFEFDEGKLIVLRNMCDVDSIIRQANEFIPDSFTKSAFHIVTVGRMTAEKGANLAVEACYRLCTEGHNICWHWIGDGNQSSVIKEKIKKLGIKGKFVLEGNQNNPYPYIKCCDIYVQPSFYEAYSTTVTEAKVLKRPIITTDVGGMREQISHGLNGMIIPIEVEAMVSAISNLMYNDELRNGFITELEKEKICSEKAILEYQKTVFS